MGCFCVLAIVNSAAVNIGECVSFSLMVFLGYMPSSGIVGSSVQFSRSVVSDSLCMEQVIELEAKISELKKTLSDLDGKKSEILTTFLN